MNKNLRSDVLHRSLFRKMEKDFLISKILQRSVFFLSSKKILSIIVSFFFYFFNGYIGKVKIHNFCYLTGRSKGIFSFFRLSRIVFRKLALQGSLPGVKKSSW